MPRSCFYEFVLLKQTIFCSLQPLLAPARYSIVVVVVVCVCARVCVLRKIVQHQHIENCHFMGGRGLVRGELPKQQQKPP